MNIEAVRFRGVQREPKRHASIQNSVKGQSLMPHGRSRRYVFATTLVKRSYCEQQRNRTCVRE